MSHSTCTIPQLHPIILSDWLPKLGEKAFLAWFHFQSWKFERNTPNDPLLIPLSLNKVIKRLKTGKATFYNQILRPLVKFGLVCLQHASNSKQEINLVVHSFPSLPPEHTDTELPTSGSPDDNLGSSLSSSQTDDSEEQNEPQTPHSESIVLENTLTYNVSLESEVQNPNQPNQHQQIKPNTFHTPSTKKTEPPTQLQSHSHINPYPALNSLPPIIQQTILGDQRLMERSREIVQAYHQCEHHPGFDEMSFNKKLLTCIEYPYVKKENFGAYLLKALFNEWNAKPPISSSTPAPTHPSARSHDVPEWVQRQQEREKLGIRNQSPDLDPEQKAEAERLMRELGEWPN